MRRPCIQGGQVAHLFYHPKLAQDFFAGRSVAPNPVTKERVGFPPKLEVLGYEVKGNMLMVRVKAHDGGDGVSVVRRWVGNAPFQKPIAIELEQEALIPFELPKKRSVLIDAKKKRRTVWSFNSVSIQACNKTGHVCSPLIQCEWDRSDEKVKCGQ